MTLGGEGKGREGEARRPRGKPGGGSLEGEARRGKPGGGARRRKPGWGSLEGKGRRGREGEGERLKPLEPLESVYAHNVPVITRQARLTRQS